MLVKAKITKRKTTGGTVALKSDFNKTFFFLSVFVLAFSLRA